VFDTETETPTTYQLGSPHHATLPLTSELNRPFPIYQINPLLVALSIYEKFKALELHGTSIPTHCLEYQERVFRLVRALEFEIQLRPLVTYDHQHMDHLMDYSDEEEGYSTEADSDLE